MYPMGRVGSYIEAMFTIQKKRGTPPYRQESPYTTSTVTALFGYYTTPTLIEHTVPAPAYGGLPTPDYPPYHTRYGSPVVALVAWV